MKAEYLFHRDFHGGYFFMQKKDLKDKNLICWKFIILGTIISALMCSVGYILSAFIFIKLESLPYVIINQLSFIIAVISVFFASLFTSRLSKSKGLLIGAIIGLLLFLIVFLIYRLLLAENITIVTAFRSLAFVLSGAIGGIIGVNKSSKRKH